MTHGAGRDARRERDLAPPDGGDRRRRRRCRSSSYVIGEGRYETQNFPAATLDEGELVWDFETNGSNYADVRKDALARHGGRSWLTTYAQQNPFFASSFAYDDSGGDYLSPTLADLYAKQALANGETSKTCTFKAPPPAARVTDCGEAGCALPNEVDAETFACGEATDLARAMTGQHPSAVWVTRLEGKPSAEGPSTWI